ncbi:MAG: hypothetical protein K9J12_06260 [Melioribacteraceae bacterium]|nr:hypothetical protein [Melioribacteraceae bacterium]MCF8265081.1 hypothetical protein [Melioribacteraceae bacterium]MCF8413358.1 hypothetical protein [Melioribacteraceae bacterium]
MKNSVKCGNCESENSFYRHICTNCGAYIRKRIENVDFWQTAWRIFESPKDTLSNIVFADHKNFSVVLSILLGVKIFLLASSLRAALGVNQLEVGNYEINIILSIVGTLGILALFSVCLRWLFKMLKIETRFKDNYALLIYSFIPILFAFFFLFPVEYALFGQYMLTFNPSPFLIRSGAANALSLIEGLMVIWTLFLLFMAVKIQSDSLILSVVLTLFISGIIGAGLIFFPLI